MAQPLLVSAAALFNEQGQVLIAKRPLGSDQGGLWEFPGGKLAPYETGFQALRREIHEELGVEIHSARPLIKIHYTYPDKTVLLDVWRVDHFTGEPWGKEGQAIRWVSVRELSQFEFPAANRAIIRAVQLPEDYMITGDFTDQSEALVRLQSALERGVRLVQLRAHHLDAEAYRQLAQAALEACKKAGASLMLNADPALLDQVDAAGIHLTEARLMAARKRPVPVGKWLGASCHGAASLQQAERIGADLVTLSPVQTTATHPGQAPLGWQVFQTLVNGALMPVYALGGLGPEDKSRVFGLGAQGVAGISRYW
ncbi:Nudix family hydrolase [Marinospirillum sp.]|uniref:Nudix family hydrolase n=1 Tax=Marinospirillum sp. TaxID=2183934 RepID=UPI003A89BAFB